MSEVGQRLSNTSEDNRVHPIFEPILAAVPGEFEHRKSSRLNLTDSEGGKYVWRFRRERFAADYYWVLMTHEGTTRVLEPTWNASVPRIRLIAENYGLTLKEDLS